MKDQGKVIDVLNAMAKSDDEPNFTSIENLSVDFEEFESLDQASEILGSSNRLKTLIKQPEVDNSKLDQLATYITEFEITERGNSAVKVGGFGKKCFEILQKLTELPYMLQTAGSAAVVVLAVSFAIRSESNGPWRGQYDQIAMAPDILSVYDVSPNGEMLMFDLPAMRGEQDFADTLRPIFDEIISEGAFSAEVIMNRGEGQERFGLERLARIEDPDADRERIGSQNLLSVDPSAECELFRLSPLGPGISQTIDRAAFYAFCDDGFLDTTVRIK